VNSPVMVRAFWKWALWRKLL